MYINIELKVQTPFLTEEWILNAELESFWPLIMHQRFCYALYYTNPNIIL